MTLDVHVESDGTTSLAGRSSVAAVGDLTSMIFERDRAYLEHTGRTRSIPRSPRLRHPADVRTCRRSRGFGAELCRKPNQEMRAQPRESSRTEMTWPTLFGGSSRNRATVNKGRSMRRGAAAESQPPAATAWPVFLAFDGGEMKIRRSARKWIPWFLVGALALVVTTLLLKDFDLNPALKWAGGIAPIAAVVVALFSFLLLAITSWATWRAARHQATLEAWTAWSDDCIDARKHLSQTLGMKVISDEQAKALADDALVLHDKAGAALSPDDRRLVIYNMIRVLNGLERLAVGVDLGIYKRDALVLVGGTIIKRSYERFEPYIRLRRTTSDANKRQEKAFDQLLALVSHIKYYEVDAERLKTLRQRST